MRIWLATVGEPLPIDEGGQRLLRTGQFARWLADRGHEIVFFTGTMDHSARRLRSPTTTTYEISPNYQIVALAGRHYERSISYDRFRNHADVAKAFSMAVSKLPPPDVVLSSYPTEELCRVILDYCEPRDIPVAIDVRDFWPDIFSELLPAPVRFLGSMVFYPFRCAARNTLRRASALSGMTQSALEWGLQLVERQQRDSDFWFPFSYDRQEAGQRVAHEGTRLCFLGTLSRRSNIEVVIDAMRLLERRGVNAHLDVCGSGEAETTLRTRAAGLSNVEFHGWLAADRLSQIMSASDLGVLPYDKADFHLSLPNKFVEYLAGGLAVLSCTDGEVRQITTRRACGIWVEPEATKMADAVATLEPHELTRLKTNATRVFQDTFDANSVFAKALAALEWMVEIEPSRRR